MINFCFRVLILFVFLSSLDAIAQENNTERLHGLTGEWTVDHFVMKDDSYQNIGTTKSLIVQEHDGEFICERTKFLTAFGEINMIAYIGFDSKLGKFKMTAMDKEYGLMDVYSGGWIKKALVFDNMNTDLPIKTRDGKELYFRVTYKDITKNGFTHLVEGSENNGESWFIFSKATFKRVLE